MAFDTFPVGSDNGNSDNRGNSVKLELGLGQGLSLAIILDKSSKKTVVHQWGFDFHSPAISIALGVNNYLEVTHTYNGDLQVEPCSG